VQCAEHKQNDQNSLLIFDISKTAHTEVQNDAIPVQSTP